MDEERLTKLQVDVLRAIRDLGPTHVYDIKRLLGSRSVYAAVSALQLKGLLEGEWEKDPPPDRPPRKIVRLSGVGRRILNEVEAGSAREIRLRPAANAGF